ncbi:hypothetical protein I0C86_38190 [Plantactinospora sp. S1510]|uniref:Uncharacterized protein n=1 Tax=Plantactinospora alkalitolerans TaxID=2789879 RepID=A0ABS0H8C3_9ACTN|nr:hypothetical protein [Plantactinospora alkalitolerans]MBF9134720.1 hypothetical protein [Plantactinospora alkalitolerans]
MMGHRLFAVLVRASVAVATIDAHLARPMRHLLRSGAIDGYRLGGQVTGAWNPDYNPAADPANWRTCGACDGTTRSGDVACAVCAEAVQAGRRPGTVVPWSCTDWARYPGDIVALPRLLHPGWRFPRGRTPIAWVDLAGVVWLGTDEAVLTGTDTGHLPPRLRRVLDDLRIGRRDPDPGRSAPRTRPRPADLVTPWRYSGRAQPQGARFNPAEWSVAVVDAHS